MRRWYLYITERKLLPSGFVNLHCSSSQLSCSRSKPLRAWNDWSEATSFVLVNGEFSWDNDEVGRVSVMTPESWEVWVFPRSRTGFNSNIRDFIGGVISIDITSSWFGAFPAPEISDVFISFSVDVKRKLSIWLLDMLTDCWILETVSRLDLSMMLGREIDLRNDDSFEAIPIELWTGVTWGIEAV